MPQLANYHRAHLAPSFNETLTWRALTPSLYRRTPPYGSFITEHHQNSYPVPRTSRESSASGPVFRSITRQESLESFIQNTVETCGESIRKVLVSAVFCALGKVLLDTSLDW